MIRRSRSSTCKLAIASKNEKIFEQFLFKLRIKIHFESIFFFFGIIESFEIFFPLIRMKNLEKYK